MGANAPPRGTGSSAFGQGCGKFSYRKWVMGVPLIPFSVLSICSLFDQLSLFDFISRGRDGEMYIMELTNLILLVSQFSRLL